MMTGQFSWPMRYRWARRLLGAAAFSALAAPLAAQTYCASDGGSGNTFNIDRVAFAGIDNTSGDNNGYADFTALSANVDPGTSYAIDLDPNGPFFLRYRWRVWIDWNQDGTFTLDERMVQQTGFGTESATIAVPAGALPGTTRMRVNMSAFSYRGACADWSVGEVEDYTVVVSAPCDAQAGSLTILKPVICFDGIAASLVAITNEQPVVPAGYQVLYVLTSGTDLVIEQVSSTPVFTVTSPGLFTMHTLVYDPNTLDLSVVVPGVTTGFDVNALLVQGGGSICAALDVTGGVTNVVYPSAGTLSGGSDVCNTTGEVTLTATANGDSNVPDGYSLAYVLTSGSDLVIQALGAEPSFTVTGGGLYTIHTFVFPSDLDLSSVVIGTTTGVDVLNLLAANNICASLDVAGAAFNISNPNAGTLSGGSDVCNTTGEVTLTATANGDSNVPDGYSLAYVLTSGSDLVIQALGAEPSFTVSGGGLYTIHTFVFPSDLDLSGVVIGTTTGGDVLNLLAANNICASLDVAGAAFNISNPNAGTLSGGGDVCNTTGEVTLTAAPNGDNNVPDGYSLAYVLTSGSDLVIQALGAEPSFTVTGGGLYTIHTFVFPSDLDLSGVVIGTTTGGDVLNLLAANNICASLDVAGAAFNISNPNAGTLSGGSDVCNTTGEVTLTATANGDSNVPDGYSLAYVLTSGSDLVIQALGAEPSFTVTGGGLYTIHTFVFPSDLDLSSVVIGTTTGVDVLNLLAANNICASLDVAGAAFNISNPNAGTLSGGSDVCNTTGEVTLTATPNGDSNVPDGYSLAYVLTSGSDLVIQALGAEPSFTVTGGGLYTIHTFVFPSDLDLSGVVIGTTTGGDVLALLAENNICASLDVAGAAFNISNPNAGTLSGGSDVCNTTGEVTLTATANGDSNVPDGYSLAYVLTSGSDLVIQALGAEPSFTVSGGGLYTIHTFVFPSDLDLSGVVIGTTTGGDVLNLLAANGVCASLDVAGAAFNISNPNAGTLSGGSDVCNTTGEVTLTATANGDSNVPDGYSLAYVLTSGSDLVIQALGAEPSFTVTGGGLYTIHTFVFPSDLDLSGVVIGETTGGDVLALLAANNICASLDVAGAAFNISNPNAGTLTAVADVVCFETGIVTIAATPNGDQVVPTGYSLLYVLTEGSGLVIQDVSSTPSFIVATTGTYTIHSFVYPNDLDLSFVEPGVTTGFDVNALLVQGGGDVCASLLVAGAVTEAVECPLCTVNAGTLSGGGDICSDGEVTITAVPNGDAIVPPGFETLYVLTQGSDLVIVNAGSEPSFTVGNGGIHTIHTLVYDPATLDLGIVEFGVTTGFDVNALLIQGGGNICASLDVTGAAFDILMPMAGTLSGGGDACLVGGAATITATADGNAIVPAGYQLVYVLTQGADLTIVNAGAAPTFEVTEAGNYTIHSLVFNPSTLDLGIVELGVTTGFDVNGLLVQGGGEICASLLVAGAQWTVNTCDNECTADAGTIAPADFLVCWQNEQIIGVPAGNALVPAGYEVLYVLTRGNGLVIRQVNTAPVFTVNQNGVYRIHTLVYDPATLDLSIVQFGTTTGFDVNGLLIQGGGSICASLDVTGAPFIAVGPVLCSLLDLFRDIDPNDAQAMQDALDRMEAGVAMSIEGDSPASITGMWPNPTRDVLNIQLELVGDQNITISVIDLSGKEVLVPATSLLGAGSNKTMLDVSALAPGSYMVRINTANSTVTERFMKID